MPLVSYWGLRPSPDEHHRQAAPWFDPAARLLDHVARLRPAQLRALSRWSHRARAALVRWGDRLDADEVQVSAAHCLTFKARHYRVGGIAVLDAIEQRAGEHAVSVICAAIVALCWPDGYLSADERTELRGPFCAFMEEARNGGDHCTECPTARQSDRHAEGANT